MKDFPVFAGIDVGASRTKAVILDRSQQISEEPWSNPVRILRRLPTNA